MKTIGLLLLLLSIASEAKPTRSEPMLYPLWGPYSETTYYPNGRVREVHTFKLTADGRYWRHIIRHASGIVEERVFPVPTFRVSPSK